MWKFLLDYVHEFWMITCMMAPWLLFGFLVSGMVSLFLSPEQIKKHLSEHSLKSVIKAALFGVPLPLCSCSVIPVAATLRKSGASKGATGAFFISTPQTGVDSIVVTWSILGWLMALLRPVIALISGVVGGVLIDRFDPEKPGENVEEPTPPCPHCKHHDADAENSDAASSRPRGFVAGVKHIIAYGFGIMLNDIVLSLTIGIGLAALISLLVPADFGARFLHSQILEFAAMLLIGIPLYICSTASVPIAGALIMKGISPGAALVFLIVGPATNSATITTMLKILGKRSTLIYLLTVSLIAILSGILLNLFNFTPTINAVKEASAHCLSLFSQLSGGLLLLLLLQSIVRNHLLPGKKHAMHMQDMGDGEK